MENPHPKVGIGVMIWKDGKVLMGRRKNSHGAGTFAWPGGHLEFMESFEDCARRETREEAGIEIKNIRFLRLCNFRSNGRHYADIGVMAEWASGEPMIMEPEKCEGWAWYDPAELPQPLFDTIPYYFDALRTGRNFYDA